MKNNKPRKLKMPGKVIISASQALNQARQMLRSALDDSSYYPQLKLPDMQQARIVRALELIGN